MLNLENWCLCELRDDGIGPVSEMEFGSFDFGTLCWADASFRGVQAFRLVGPNMPLDIYQNLRSGCKENGLDKRGNRGVTWIRGSVGSI